MAIFTFYAITGHWALHISRVDRTVTSLALSAFLDGEFATFVWVMTGDAIHV